MVRQLLSNLYSDGASVRVSPLPWLMLANIGSYRVLVKLIRAKNVGSGYKASLRALELWQT